MSSTNWGRPAANRLSGTIRAGHGSAGQQLDANRRGGLQRLPVGVEWEQNRAPAAGRGQRVVMEHRKQVAEPVGGRQRLEQAGLA